MADHLLREIDAFKTRERLKDQEIASQRAEIATLRASLGAFVNENRGQAFSFDVVTKFFTEAMAHEPEPLDEEQDGSHEREETLPDAVWDTPDQVFRCSVCVWEVIDRTCQSCGTKHNCDTEDSMRIPPSISINNESVSSDRRLTCRGSTPLLDIGNESIPIEYHGGWCQSTHSWLRDRSEEYRALLSRGATRLMCETFHLEFTPENGIFAWADNEIYNMFSGPAMKQGHFWKIYLGRRIELDEDDLDGSQFIEGLLEDVLLFPLIANRWETVGNGLGVWETRLVSSTQAERPSEWESDSSEDTGDETSQVSNDWRDSEPELEEDEQSDFDAQALPLLVGLLPVIQPDEYELSDVESVTVSDGEMADPGFMWQAGVPDDAYPSSDEEQPEQGSDIVVDEESGVWAGVGPQAEDREIVDEDCAGSDFDSDEVLSGDEDVMYGW